MPTYGPFLILSPCKVSETPETAVEQGASLGGEVLCGRASTGEGVLDSPHCPPARYVLGSGAIRPQRSVHRGVLQVHRHGYCLAHSQQVVLAPGRRGSHVYVL